MAIEKCAHCGTEVLFSTEYCPACHTSRVTGALEPGYTERPRSGITPGDQQLAGRGSRLGASILDSLITFGAMIPGGALLFASDGQEPGSIVGGAVLGVSVLALVLYQIYLLSTQGQSLGKKVVGVRIVNYQDGGNPGFVRVILLRSVVLGLVGAIPLVGPIVSFVDIMFIFGEERRCIHDHIASTRVVMA